MPQTLGFARTSVSATQAGPTAPAANPDDAPAHRPGAPFKNLERPGGPMDGLNEELESAGRLNGRNDMFYGRRTTGTNPNFSVADAAAARGKAEDQAVKMAQQAALTPTKADAFGGAWAGFGPNPIVQVDRTPPQNFYAVSGRIAALAIRSTAPYSIYLGSATGGVWISSTLTSGWVPRGFSGAYTMAAGAIALAPSNENIVYVGTGEGNLSGDSYMGSGVFKSTDAGGTFVKVSGAQFNQVSISKMAVDPTNPNHVYIATLSGNAGKRRTRPVLPSGYGIWESTDGGATWAARLVTTNRLNGATDLVMDPRNPSVLFASFWGLGIYKTTDGGVTWNLAMNGLPAGVDYAFGPTRFSLGISNPVTAQGANPPVQPTLYTGFEYFTAQGDPVTSKVYKSTDGGANWTNVTDTIVDDFCGTQCWYDNVIDVDPSNPNIAYALGLFNYNTGAGGIFRTKDGGATWVDIGYGMHPDYHAIAIRKDAPQYVVIGSDGGVWKTANYGGRNNPGDPLSAVDWFNMNGQVNPATAAVGARYNLQVTALNSVANHPTIAGRIFGGSQDNGTERKSGASQTWFDQASGDGGQVLVDPLNPQYVYGTYFGVSPYRFNDGMVPSFFSNVAIRRGIDTTERSEFYIPWIIDPAATNRLYLGTYHLYRTDNRGDQWSSISTDLTGKCASSATSRTNYSCTITAIGASSGGPAVYVGTGDGYLWLSTDADQATPTWTRLDAAAPNLPIRTICDIQVDNDYRTAYVAYCGFNTSTAFTPGHVFKTTNAGQTWTNISGNLPDAPVNTLQIDPSKANTLYAGTDVGAMVTTDGGVSWQTLGTGLPTNPVFQLSLNPYLGALRAASYHRGAWSLSNPTPTPALRISKSIPSSPIGPNSLITYTLTVQNWGNAQATGATIQDQIPANTSFVSATAGGSLVSGKVTWTGLTVPVPTVNHTNLNCGGDCQGIIPGALQVSFTVRAAGTLVTGDVITNDDFSVTSAENAGSRGSPFKITIAPQYNFSLTPATQFDGTNVGQVITYTQTVKNQGYGADRYNLSLTGNVWPTTLWNSTFTSQITQTGSVPGGATTNFGVKVAIPNSGVPITDTVTVKAASVGLPSASKTAQITTAGIASQVLVVDQAPEDQSANVILPFYTSALTKSGVSYRTWNLILKPVIPTRFMQAFKSIIWFTGSFYPNAITPYEGQLTAYLTGGGRLFMNGADILDQSGGVTPFVQNYLHIAWDGTETQNDKDTLSVRSVVTNTITAGLPVTMTLSHAAPFTGYVPFSDQITPIAPAVQAFKDDAGKFNALTVTVIPVANQAAAVKPYKVVFLAFPYEAMGSAADRAILMKNVLMYFDYSYSSYPLIGH
jgi:uncharacterized repeat protein (TIGR01451 family)